MKADLERWFSDPAYGLDWQDLDLILADISLLPRLITYLDEPTAPAQKKHDVIAAVLELMDDVPEESSQYSKMRDLIRNHADIAEEALPELGVTKEHQLRNVLS